MSEPLQLTRRGLHIEMREDHATLTRSYRTEIAVISPFTSEPVKLGAVIVMSRQMLLSMSQEQLDEVVFERLRRELDSQIEQMDEAWNAYCEACGEGGMRRVPLEPPYYTPVPTEDGKTVLMTQEEISAFINGKLAGYVKPGSFRVTPAEPLKVDGHLAWCSSLVGFEQPCNCKQEGE